MGKGNGITEFQDMWQKIQGDEVNILWIIMDVKTQVWSIAQNFGVGEIMHHRYSFCLY